MKKVMTIFGTRPEAIKMAPVVHELNKYPDEIKSIVLVTGQHREMLDQVLSIFDIEPQYDLDIMSEKQKLSTVTTKIAERLEPILEKEQVDMLLVQGDTTTSFTAALIGFYHKVPVGHIEAGLRTFDMYNPFPEEINRTLTSRLATVHFAPTELSKRNLLNEGIAESKIEVTGNTVIDALLFMVKKEKYDITTKCNGKKKLLVTAHRRENWGKALENICFALLEIIDLHDDVEIIFPMHLNPVVQDKVRSILSDSPKITLLNALGYKDFCKEMAESYLILSDSGGVQEEAPSLGKPVLVLRTETERQEAVEAGTIRLVGTKKEDIVSNANELLTDQDKYMEMANAINPFGDGTTSKEIVQYILTHDFKQVR